MLQDTRGTAPRLGIRIMSRAIAALLAPAMPGHSLHGFLNLIRRCWRELTRDAVRPYRPERHYMRGPGPAWQAKHGIH
jgi:hypothetical protein